MRQLLPLVFFWTICLTPGLSSAANAEKNVYFSFTQRDRWVFVEADRTQGLDSQVILTGMVDAQKGQKNRVLQPTRIYSPLNSELQLNSLRSLNLKANSLSQNFSMRSKQSMYSGLRQFELSRKDSQKFIDSNWGKIRSELLNKLGIDSAQVLQQELRTDHSYRCDRLEDILVCSSKLSGRLVLK